MKIKVFADTICGWCFIGHLRLNNALEKFRDVDLLINLVLFLYSLKMLLFFLSAHTK